MKGSATPLLPTLAWLCCMSALMDPATASSSPHYAWGWGKKLHQPLKSPYADYDYDGGANFYHPFPGAPPPVVRPDGTTKSRVPQDTLLTEHDPHFEGGFTSLDEHLKGQAADDPDPPLEGTIGDLSPDEVFYADDDLLIIKGGGFPNPSHEEPLQEIRPLKEEAYPAATPSGVRSAPSPHDEYNGNVPTIVKPPPQAAGGSSYWAASHYPPFALFIPARIFASDFSSFYLYVPYLPPSPYNYIATPHRAAPATYFPEWDARPSPQLVPKPLKQPPKEFVSLLGDTDVNYLHPRPSIEPDAEIVSPAKPGHRQTYAAKNYHRSHTSYLSKLPKRPK